MEDQNKHIDDLFREGLGNYAETPPPAVWSDLEKRLDGEDRKPGFPSRLLWYALGIAMLLLLSYLFVSNALNRQKGNKSAVVPAVIKDTVVPLTRLKEDTLVAFYNDTAAIGSNAQNIISGHTGHRRSLGHEAELTGGLENEVVEHESGNSMHGTTRKRLHHNDAKNNKEGNSNMGSAYTGGSNIKAGQKDKDGIAIIHNAPGENRALKSKKARHQSGTTNEVDRDPDPIGDQKKPPIVAASVANKKSVKKRLPATTVNPVNNNEIATGISNTHALPATKSPAKDRGSALPAGREASPTISGKKIRTKASVESTVPNAAGTPIAKSNTNHTKVSGSGVAGYPKVRASIPGKGADGQEEVNRKNHMQPDLEGNNHQQLNATMGNTTNKAQSTAGKNNVPERKSTGMIHGSSSTKHTVRDKPSIANKSFVPLKPETSGPHKINPQAATGKKRPYTNPVASDIAPRPFNPKPAKFSTKKYTDPTPEDYEKKPLNIVGEHDLKKPGNPIPEMKDQVVVLSHKNKPQTPAVPNIAPVAKTHSTDGIPVVIPATFADDNTDDKEEDMDAPIPLNSATIVDRERVPDYLKINTNEAGGGGNGVGGDAATEERKDKKQSPWSGGIKAGYEAGQATYTAKKLLLSAYFKYKVSDNVAFLLQPTLKSAKANVTIAQNAESFYRLKNAGRTQLSPLPQPTDSTLYVFTYQYHSNYDSVVVGNKINGNSYLEFELPVLAEIKLSEGISLIGGMSMAYSKLVNSVRSESIYDKTQTSIVKTAPILPPGLPIPPDIAGMFQYGGKPYTNYTPPTATNYTSPLRFGFMIGFSATVWDKFIIDLMVSQNITNLNGVSNSNIKSTYMQPYFRLTLGYRIW